MNTVNRWLWVYYSSIREPQVQLRRDRRGRSYFLAYDPKTQTHRSFSSEAELRIWLDQRY